MSDSTQQGERAPSDVTRRDFLKTGALAGAGLTLAFVLPARARSAFGALGDAQAAAPPASFAPNAWLSIAPDGVVLVQVDRSEMGQGVLTALPMIVAEELDADWSRVRAEHLPVDAAHPFAAQRMRITGGSSSVRGSWKPAREAGAAARAMLVAAAAER
ncbi:MAG TPA: molybdopterin cofactor-binding domain-containing protein, partial [Gemmatimonadaceae bacterium]|nr:molybdopterin cofactor-binding domain-containing protein [Gemmatimonadaceae bacterium]